MTAVLDSAGSASEFRRAIAVLRQHCLKQSAAFCAEQLVGLAKGDVNVNAASLYKVSNGAGRMQSFAQSSSSMDVDEEISSPALATLRLLESEVLTDTYLYAQSLFEVGEYLRAAVALAGHENEGGALPARIPDDSAPSREQFLWAYAIFMAGEKGKEESIAEAGRQNKTMTECCNPWLDDLRKVLEAKKKRGALRGLCPYALGMVLKEVAAQCGAGGFEPSNDTMVEKPLLDPQLPQKLAQELSRGPSTRILHSQSSSSKNTQIEEERLDHIFHASNTLYAAGIEAARQARDQLVISASLFPWNWSAWLDLADISIPTGSRPEESIEPGLVPLQTIPFDHLAQNQSSESVGPSRLRIDSTGILSACYGARLAVEGQCCEEALEVLAELSKLVPTSSFVLSQEALAHYARRDFDTARNTFEKLRTKYPYRLDQLDVYSNVLYVKEERAELSLLAHSAFRTDKYRPETCCIIGNYYSLRRQHERAVLYFRRALRLDRKCLSAWTLMGHEFIELKNTNAAVESYRRAVDTNARDYRAWYGLGQTYEMLTMHFYALYYYRKAARLRPNDGRMWIAIANCHEQLQRIPEAMQFYQKAAQIDDAEGHAALKLAKLHRYQNDDQVMAAHYYSQYLNIAGDSEILDTTAEAILFLALHHKAAGDLSKAQTLLARLLDFAGPEKIQAEGILREVRALLDAGIQSDLRNSSSPGGLDDDADIDLA